MSFTVWEILLYVVLALGVQTAIGILMERRDPVATIAWLLVLVLLPGIGLPIYLIFGRRRVRKKIMESVSAVRRAAEVTSGEHYRSAPTCGSERLPPFDRPISDLIKGLTGVNLRPGNTVRILQDGVETFAAFVESIESAEHFVHFEYFIYRPGEIGDRMRDALVSAARRGVEVRMIFDAFGSHQLDHEYLQPILDAGGRYADFNKVRLSRLRRRPDFRNHRKIQVVDGRIGFVGGLNIMDEYLDKGEPGTPWRDTHLRIEGPIVHDLERAITDMWLLCTEEVLAKPEHFPEVGTPGSVMAQLVTGGPEDDWTNIEKVLNLAVHSARESVDITTPYFIPSHTLVAALSMAALRGVRVRMLVPARGDHRIVEWAGRSYYPELIDAGIQIYEYGPRMMHAKVASIDRRFCAVGTPNLDIRSLRLNYEVSAVLFDEAVTTELDRGLAADFAQAKRVEIEPEGKRPLMTRLKENTARLLSPLL